MGIGRGLAAAALAALIAGCRQPAVGDPPTGEWNVVPPAAVRGPIAPVVEDTAILVAARDCTHPERDYPGDGAPPLTLCVGRGEERASMYVVDSTGLVMFASATGPTGTLARLAPVLAGWRADIERRFGPPARVERDLVCWRADPFTVTIELVPADGSISLETVPNARAQLRLTAERPGPDRRQC